MVIVRVDKEEGISVVVLRLVLLARMADRVVDTAKGLEVLEKIDIKEAAVLGSELIDVVDVVEALEEVSWGTQALSPHIGQGPKLKARE